MTDLITRVRTALGSEWRADGSPWEGLMRLYEVDADAFYLLACGDMQPSDPLDALARLGEPADPVVGPLDTLAQRVRRAIRASYRLVSPTDGEGQVVTPDDRLTVPAHLFPRVRHFLMELDDKGVSEKPGKDYHGEAVSEAEVYFKLGSREERTQVEGVRQARREAKPLVFHVSPEDLHSLRTLPAYVTYGLLKCARKTVLAPTSIYRGLKRGDKAPPRLREGWAICGKPNRAYDNAGGWTAPPADMVYMVYADAERCVFDWDWVQEDPHAPGHPLDADLRFDQLMNETPEMILELPERIDSCRFDATKPAPSSRGDCVFCYLDAAPSYGARINEDLTVFYCLDDRETITGFKIKNVHRILCEEQSLKLKDAPGLNVLILPILRKTLRDHENVTIKLYELIIRALVGVKIPLPQLVGSNV